MALAMNERKLEQVGEAWGEGHEPTQMRGVRGRMPVALSIDLDSVRCASARPEAVEADALLRLSESGAMYGDEFVSPGRDSDSDATPDGKPKRPRRPSLPELASAMHKSHEHNMAVFLAANSSTRATPKPDT